MRRMSLGGVLQSRRVRHGSAHCRLFEGCDTVTTDPDTLKLDREERAKAGAVWQRALDDVIINGAKLFGTEVVYFILGMRMHHLTAVNLAASEEKALGEKLEGMYM